MRFGPGTFVAFLAACVSTAAMEWPPQASPAPTPSASSTPSPPVLSPSPKYKLLPYGFVTTQERSTVPLLRFNDEAEVRSFEMNAAIARFFDKSDDKGNMLRGATPGGAPTLRDMAPYRPHVTPAINLLGVAVLAAKEIRKQIDQHQRMPAADPSPSPKPSPGSR